MQEVVGSIPTGSTNILREQIHDYTDPNRQRLYSARSSPKCLRRRGWLHLFSIRKERNDFVVDLFVNDAAMTADEAYMRSWPAPSLESAVADAYVATNQTPGM